MRADAVTALVEAGRVLGAAGLAPGTSGNLSVRQPEGFLVTGTGVRLAELCEDELSEVDREGRLRRGAAPTKESALHAEIYRNRPGVGAIVHLHSPAAVAVSCLADLGDQDPLPVYTPYYAMRVGHVGVVPYVSPGERSLALVVAEALKGENDAAILRNHGTVCVGTTLEDAVAAAEELEANCALHFTLHGRATSSLDGDEAAALIEKWHRPRGA